MIAANGSGDITQSAGLVTGATVAFTTADYGEGSHEGAFLNLF